MDGRKEARKVTSFTCTGLAPPKIEEAVAAAAPSFGTAERDGGERGEGGAKNFQSKRRKLVPHVNRTESRRQGCWDPPPARESPKKQMCGEKQIVFGSKVGSDLVSHIGAWAARAMKLEV
jgi:hypothetical protein